MLNRLLVVLILSFLLCKCNSIKKIADPELEMIRNFARAEVNIEMMRKQTNPDWEAIKEQYEITSDIVRKIDEKWNLDYNNEIRIALEKCTKDEKIKVNQQILAKGLQHIAVLAIQNELEEMSKADENDRIIYTNRIREYFEGIRPTFVRRDQNFFPQTKTLETAANNALQNLQKNDSGSLITAKRELDDVILRTYALCVLFEIMELEKYRETDIETCDVKLIEAKIFYRILQPYIRKYKPQNDELITNVLNANYDSMNSELLEKYLSESLSWIELR